MMTTTEALALYPTPSAQQYLTLFTLGKQIYALPVENVVQIIPMVSMMRLPQAHPAVRGLINVHGMLIPVVSLSHLLGLDETPLGLHTPILLVRYSKYTLGMIVEDVVDVMAVTGREVESPDHLLPEALRHTTALVALSNTARGTVFILDMARLFEDHRQDGLLESLDNIATSVGEKAPAAAPVPTSMDTRSQPEGPASKAPTPELAEKAPLKIEKKSRKKVTQAQENAPGSTSTAKGVEPASEPGDHED